MNKKKLLIFLCVVILILPVITSINSSTYSMDTVVSSGGENTSSDNYQNDIVIGTISGETSSSLYETFLGWFFGKGATDVEVPVAGVCGDGNLDAGEACDDGNTNNGDGCSSTCTIETTPVVPPAGGGSGGGGGEAKVAKFEIDKDLIKVLIKQGDTVREIITVENIGDYDLNLELDLGGLENYIIASEDSFLLEVGESKEIKLDIFASEDEIADVYTGTLILSEDSRDLSEKINTIIEIKERQPLFDVVVDIFFRRVLPGRDVSANIDVINMGDLEGFDILVYYAIKDFEGNVLNFKEESIAIDNTLEISRRLGVPIDAELGDYVFYTKVSYRNITASSTDSFKVVERWDLLTIVIWSLVTLFILFLIFFIWRRRKHKKEVKVLEHKKRHLHKTILDHLRRKKK